ncbi:MAG: UpxY family transcription antiterminator [Cytophagales bacterium]|nr:UpxY family transcription antiterminator [Cytophagales bacterium]
MEMHNEPLMWHVLHVQSGYEKHVASQLKYGGVECYIPVTKEVKYWGNQHKQVYVPLFPGIIFCHMCEADRMNIRDIEVLQSYIIPGQPEGHVILPKEEIAIIKLLEKGNPGLCEEHLFKGDAVVVMEGPFTGFHGIMIDGKASKRLLVRLTGLKQIVAVDISPFQIQKAKSSHVLAS